MPHPKGLSVEDSRRRWRERQRRSRANRRCVDAANIDPPSTEPDAKRQRKHRRLERALIARTQLRLLRSMGQREREAFYVSCRRFA